MSTLQITELQPQHLTPGEPPRLVSGGNGEVFKVRAKGDPKGRQRYEVWHPWAWPQQPLTQTQWLVCANFESVVETINEHSKD